VNTRAQAVLWMMQRASAAILALCVLVHLGTMIYAVRGGLSAAEILGRTKGSVAWLAFYAVFVLAVAVHVPIGLRAVLIDWTRWKGVSRELAMLLFGICLFLLGMRAAIGVFG
jgi:fumarate reductase subunit C